MQRKLLVGLIGANIQKSLSPLLHEDAMEAAGIKGHYHLMDFDLLPGRRLEDLLSSVRQTGFAGVNVTFPSKETVLPLLDEVSAEARQIGAVNTVTIDRNGRTVGYNTDRTGFRASFEETLGRAAVDGKTAVVVGAGGAGRAVAFALLDLGAGTILVHDRDPARATALVAELILQFGAPRCQLLSDLRNGLAGAVGVVNATPTGMLNFAGSAVPFDALKPGHWVADVVYTPLETELIKAARTRGARVLTGGGMCVHQAAASYRLFVGAAPDIKRMHRVFAQAVALRDAALTSVA